MTGRHRGGAAVSTLALAVALLGCSDGGGVQRAYFSDEIGPVTLAAQTEAELAFWVRDWLTNIHMEAAEIDCVVSKIKGSRSWQPEPPELSLSARNATKFAQECGVDISELYFLTSD